LFDNPLKLSKFIYACSWGFYFMKRKVVEHMDVHKKSFLTSGNVVIPSTRNKVCMKSSVERVGFIRIVQV
jgi:hypothetical protein